MKGEVFTANLQRELRQNQNEVTHREVVREVSCIACTGLLKDGAVQGEVSAAKKEDRRKVEMFARGPESIEREGATAMGCEEDVGGTAFGGGVGQGGGDKRQV